MSKAMNLCPRCGGDNYGSGIHGTHESLDCILQLLLDLRAIGTHGYVTEGENYERWCRHQEEPY